MGMLQLTLLVKYADQAERPSLLAVNLGKPIQSGRFWLGVERASRRAGSRNGPVLATGRWVSRGAPALALAAIHSRSTFFALNKTQLQPHFPDNFHSC